MRAEHVNGESALSNPSPLLPSPVGDERGPATVTVVSAPLPAALGEGLRVRAFEGLGMRA